MERAQLKLQIALYREALVMWDEFPSFNELVDLAKRDPDKLEELRVQWSEKIISSASPEQQKRLQGMQFKIDMERRRSKSPLATCIRVSSLMHQTFTELCANIENLYGDLAPETPKQTAKLYKIDKKQ